MLDPVVDGFEVDQTIDSRIGSWVGPLEFIFGNHFRWSIKRLKSL